MRGGLETPFVGRAEELAALHACLARAQRGEPGVVLIEGEPGIGKSTLLSHFIRSVPRAAVLRATGDEAESMVPFGMVRQLVAGAHSISAKRSALLRQTLEGEVDPLAAGQALLALFGGSKNDAQLVVVAIDDLHWTDRPSAIVLRLAMRRASRIPLLALFASRSGQSVRLGEDWAQFVSGDHRVTRLRIAGLGRRELVVLAAALGAGRLSPWAAARLREHTGGNPLHCCALLEELDAEVWTRAERLPAPRALASLVLARLGKLSADTQELVSVAAVLGNRGRLDTAAVVAGMANPVAALQEAVEAGLLAETREGPGAEISFTHALIQRAVYDDLGPARRRQIHNAVVPLIGPLAALPHRVAAAFGPDANLANDLEAAASSAQAEGHLAEGAAWHAQAAVASVEPSERTRRALRALELLVQIGDVAEADALLAGLADLTQSARLTGLIGELDLMAGRLGTAKQRLLAAWTAHDPDAEPGVGARAALSLAQAAIVEGRPGEATAWGERAIGSARADPPMRRQAQALAGLMLVLDATGPEGPGRMGALAPAASDASRNEPELLLWQGVASFLGGELDAAIADLSLAVAGLHSAGKARVVGHCLCWLAEAEYARGDWDDSALHAELAVKLAQDSGRVWDLCFGHAAAAAVAAARGDWPGAAIHVESSREAAGTVGLALTVNVSALAGARLALARGHPHDALDALGAVRDIGSPEIAARRSVFQRRALELDALTRLGQLSRAARSERDLKQAARLIERPADAVTVARLSGNLAQAKGEPASAEMSFRQAWAAARRLTGPFEIARLELDDGSRLRRTGRRGEAVQRLQSARRRLESLRAAPFVERCDEELEACGVGSGAEVIPSALGLTRSELAVAGLVAKGRSNREVAAELFLSVKTVEFHLRHVFSKLQIRGRHELADLMHG
ncbi:MAG: helix-turn-helix transcriptional regulator [Solirubrobacteraceae bacterium]